MSLLQTELKDELKRQKDEEASRVQELARKLHEAEYRYMIARRSSLG